jgi:hypothetical protein
MPSNYVINMRTFTAPHMHRDYNTTTGRMPTAKADNAHTPESLLPNAELG